MATPTSPADPYDDVLGLLAKHRLIPVVVLRNADDAAPLADALEDGGLPVAEITFRTDAAEASIKAMADRGGVHVGAGTLATPEQVDRAVDAGATFAVTPGFHAAVVERCQERGLPVFPGVCTPSDVERARAAGLSTVKFFPAEAYGGVTTLKALAGPYPRHPLYPHRRDHGRERGQLPEAPLGRRLRRQLDGEAGVVRGGGFLGGGACRTRGGGGGGRRAKKREREKVRKTGNAAAPPPGRHAPQLTC